jgi:hypothetical protein
MDYNVHNVLKKKRSLEYNKSTKCEKLIFDDDLKY